MPPDRRAGADNCVWLCQNCAKLIDNDPARYSVSVLRNWKSAAEAQARVMLGKALGGQTPQWLSAEEIEILKSAARDGDIWWFQFDSAQWVRAGAMDFEDPSDPAFAAAYVDGLEALKRRELARHRSGVHYTLTLKGFRVARALLEPRTE